MTGCKYVDGEYLNDGQPCRTCDVVPARLVMNTRRGPLPTDCWQWTGTISSQGYGVLSIHDRQFKAHRVSYERYAGTIPDGLVLDHLCRNRACVNPDHLEPVTDKVNVGRSPIAPTAVNARKVECVNGHPFTPDNTRYDRGKRYCLECKRRRTRVSARRRRARGRGDVA